MLRGDALPPLKWTPADEEGLVQFLVNEKSFNEDRVRKAVQRVNASKSKATQGVPQSSSDQGCVPHRHHASLIDGIGCKGSCMCGFNRGEF